MSLSFSKGLIKRYLLMALAFPALFFSSVYGQSTDQEIEDVYNIIQDNKSLISNINKQISELKKSIVLTENEKVSVFRKISEFVRKADDLETKIIIFEYQYKKSIDERSLLQEKLNKLNWKIEAKREELRKLILVLLKFVKLKETVVLPTDSLKRIPVRESNAFRQYAYKQTLLIAGLNKLRVEQQKLIDQIKKKELHAHRQKKKTESLLKELKFNQTQYETYLENLNRAHQSGLVSLDTLQNKSQNLNEQLNRLWKIYLATKRKPGSSLTGFGKSPPPFLLQPLDGKMVTPFGSKDQDIKGSMFRGVMIEPPEKGINVLAAYSGNVSYITQLRGFGNVVILDHGKSDYTVYGMLGDIFAKTGTYIKKGEPLGIAGKNEEGKFRFYFELRINKRPVNPIKYISKYTWK